VVFDIFKILGCFGQIAIVQGRLQ